MTGTHIFLCRAVHVLLAFGSVLTFLLAFSVGIPDDQRPMYGAVALSMLAAGSIIAGAVSSLAVGSLPSVPVACADAYFAVHGAISKRFPYFAPRLNDLRKARIRERLVARADHGDCPDTLQNVLRKHYRLVPCMTMMAVMGLSHAFLTGVLEETSSGIYSTRLTVVPVRFLATAVLCWLLPYCTFVVSFRASVFLSRSA